MKTLKTDLQSQIRQEMTNLSNDEVINKFKALKDEQREVIAPSLAMALGNTITAVKRVLVDRGIDYLAIA
jgi:hypothetical protein